MKLSVLLLVICLFPLIINAQNGNSAGSGFNGKSQSNPVDTEQTLKLRSMVNGLDPIRAKIGKKHGLKFDRRYSIYEERLSRKNKIRKKRIAVVKTMKMSGNTENYFDRINSSTFYQIAGKKVYNNGMYLEKQRDMGINLFVGGSPDGILASTGRLEYYFSRGFDDMIQQGKTAKGLSSIKVYLQGGHKSSSYLLNELNEDVRFIRGSFGFNKDFYPFRFLHWGPYLGYGMESASLLNSPNSISTNFLETGVRMGVNLTHNLQLIASSNFYILFNSILLDGDKDVIKEDYDYIDSFKDRAGPDFSLGLRIML